MASRKTPSIEHLIYLACYQAALTEVLIRHDGEQISREGIPHLAAERANELMPGSVAEFSRRFP